MYYTKRNSVGQIALITVLIFITFHILQWSARCGPFASGKYRDYCTDVIAARTSKNIIVNETTVARNRAIAKTPYVDLRDTTEPLEEFLPTGHGRAKNNANVREGPGMTYEVFDNLTKDSVVEIIDERDGWLQVRVNRPGDAETFGWVWHELLTR